MTALSRQAINSVCLPPFTEVYNALSFFRRMTELSEATLDTLTSTAGSLKAKLVEYRGRGSGRSEYHLIFC